MVRKEVSKSGIRWLPSPIRVVEQSSEAAIDHPRGGHDGLSLRWWLGWGVGGVEEQLLGLS